MIAIPESFHDLLKDETRAFAYLATVMKDGSPQVTPVWFNVDGDYILVNSAVGRVKDRNMRRDGRVALTIQDPKNPYRYVQVRGQVLEFDTMKGRQHIDALAKKYKGLDRYDGPSNQQRMLYRIKIKSVDAHG